MFSVRLIDQREEERLVLSFQGKLLEYHSKTKSSVDNSSGKVEFVGCGARAVGTESISESFSSRGIGKSARTFAAGSMTGEGAAIGPTIEEF